MSVRRAPAVGFFAVLLVAHGAAANCFDRVENGPESDVDCGGDCTPCERGDRCTTPHDCYSGRCAEGVCQERPYVPGTSVPPGYTVETSEADGAAVCRTFGWIALGVGYGGAYATALALPGEVGWMMAPVVGPWVEVFQHDQGYRGLIALDALVQTVGAGLLVGGLAAQGKQLVRNESVVARLRVVPVVARDQSALFLNGTF